MGAVGAILTVVQMILMIGTIIPTENALRKLLMNSEDEDKIGIYTGDQL